MDPATFSAVRFVVSAIPFLPFVFHARDDIKTRNAGMELGLWVSLGYLIEAIGLLTADAGRASFISLFTVIVVPLLDGILGAIIPARTWFGVLMSALGVAMLECSGSPPSVGDLLNFLSAIFFGIHMLRTEHISRSTKKENFLPLLGYEVCVVALLSTIWVLIGGWFDGVHGFNQLTWTWTELWDWSVAFPWIPALYTGIFSTGLCLWVEIAAMRDVSATETAIIYGLEPLWGAGFAWFLLGERWGTSGWIGAALVLGGSLMVQIFGYLPPNKSIEDEEANQKGDLLRVPDKRKSGLVDAISNGFLGSWDSTVVNCVRFGFVLLYLTCNSGIEAFKHYLECPSSGITWYFSPRSIGFFLPNPLPLVDWAKITLYLATPLGCILEDGRYFSLVAA
uniref:EamA domain-containing protein n=1 Tax=Fagus sylvatica TaxID=28930 RepID=A0A2N9FT91_FAGSY